MKAGEAVVIDVDGLDRLITALSDSGRQVIGPVVRDGAVVHGKVSGVADLPVGWHDRQEPGRYRLDQQGDRSVFGWAVGPASPKSTYFPPEETIWRATTGPAGVHIEEQPGRPDPNAFVGMRPCEAAGLDVLDRVLRTGSVPDPRYRDRRADTFVVVAECGRPAGTCFCTSMGTGPGVEHGYDVALTEIEDQSGHRFLARAGSERGAAVLELVPGAPPTAADLDARAAVLDGAATSMGHRMEADGLPELLARNLEHPRWEEVAERCLSCGNCTLVCPTCFCSDVHDVSNLDGAVERHRTWSSCFDLAHSELHSGPVRASVRSRYRQWLTHKLSTWWDQFDTSGCVGCGRCIAWCPVGIDLTEEVAAIAATDGAVGGSPSRRGSSTPST